MKEVYPREYESGEEAYQGISSYIDYYNQNRIHQSLDYSTPVEVYHRKVT
jgi:putative transposase